MAIFSKSEKTKISSNCCDNDSYITRIEIEKPITEYMWVEGYKGLSKDMTAQYNFKYELNKEYTTLDSETGRGFFFTNTIEDVLQVTRPLKNGNRFFKVKGLVPAKDGQPITSFNLATSPLFGYKEYEAVKIIILEEVPINKIIQIASNLWNEGEPLPEKYWETAIQISWDKGIRDYRKDELVKLGYSLPFATYLGYEATAAECKRAMAIAEESCSMDMKVLFIMKG